MPNKRRNFGLWKKYEILRKKCELEIPSLSVQTILQNRGKIICEFESGCEAGMKRKAYAQLC